MKNSGYLGSRDYGWVFFWFLLAFGAVTISPILGLSQSFDDTGYILDGWLDTPMNTIAGLTDWAQMINEVYGLTTLILIFVFFSVSVPLVITIIKFRVKDEDLPNLKPPKQVHGNAVLEFIWTVVPVILLLFIAVPTWKGIFSIPTKAPDNALRVKVIGHQWWWEFQYPDYGITTANELHLPENTPVFFELTSADVIHSFWIPKFGGKVDVLPGEDAVNTMFFTSPALSDAANADGEYYQGQCVELCGLSHALMRFEAVLMSADSFEKWRKNFNAAPVVASELEKKGEALFAQCQVCHTVSGTPSEALEKTMLSLSPPTPKLGPNLTNFGNRRTLGAGTRKNTYENFAKWVRDPQSMKPGSTMTAFPGLSDSEIQALAAYLRYSTAKTI